jgi:hypothetical protein
MGMSRLETVVVAMTICAVLDVALTKRPGRVCGIPTMAGPIRDRACSASGALPWMACPGWPRRSIAI